MKRSFLGFSNIVVIALLSICFAEAREKNIRLEGDYTGDLQYNLKKNFNQANLISLKSDFLFGKNNYFSLQTITFFKTSDERIVSDLQEFSNIEEENVPVNIFKAGYTHTFKNGMLFGGIRNVNEDYFTSDYTSLFTGSSCGIYPTISADYPLANYPLSAMCLHGQYNFSKGFTLKSSIYNGVAREFFKKGPSGFSIAPHRDGVFFMSELSHTFTETGYGFYSAGIAFHLKGNEYGFDDHHTKKYAKTNYSVWLGVEKSLYRTDKKEIGILLQASGAPKKENDCRYYGAGGIILKNLLFEKKTNSLGVILNKAFYDGISETVCEFTYRYEFSDHLAVQPTFNYIKTGGMNNSVALFRLYYSIKNY